MSDGQRGFTLLEVIVAITLASLATLLGAAVLRMGGDFYERAHTYLREQQELRGTLRVLRQEMQAVPKGAVALRGNATQVDLLSEKPPLSTGLSKPTLISLGCMEVAPGRLALVHLMRLDAGLSSQMAEAALKAELAQVANPAGTAAPPPPPPPVMTGASAEPVYEQEVLMSALNQCSFSYLAKDEKERVAAWLDDWGMERKGMPLAVRVRLGTAREGALPPVVIPIKSESRL